MRSVHIQFALLLCCSVPMFAAPSECWLQRKHGRRVEAHACFENLVQSADAYDKAEGLWGLEEWDQANAQFRLATQSEDSNPEYKVRWGFLLHERFNDTDAAGLFHEALKKDPNNAEAYLGLANVAADSFDGTAASYAIKALAADPKMAAAHELLANLALESDDRKQAAIEADKAVALTNDALDAMAVHAAIELIEDRAPDSWFAKIKTVNPNYGEAYQRVAHHLELHYRYEDAVTYLRKAVETDPQLWSAHSALGIELMRLGKTEEPIHELQLSYDHGFRDAATANSLTLLDSIKKKFDTFYRDNLTLVLNKGEADLMRPYLDAEVHNILATYSKKYQMTLPGPVQVEMYPDHEDFAVRTMGMPGLGALGVTFYQVVAMDRPSARKPGDFNWSATLWHEMRHVFIITATHGRVPRWFTEGLAVHEEGEHSPEWSDRVTPEVLVAIRDKKFLPIADLDRGFVHQEYPSQVIVSYFQAGSICDFIKSKWGEGKLLDIVHSYAKLTPTTEMVKADLGMSAEEFDKQYLAWIDSKYGAEATGFEIWKNNLKTLVVTSETKQYDAVIAQGSALIAKYPEYTGDANAYELVAGAYQAKGDDKLEAATLAAYKQHGGESPVLLKRLAALQEKAGQTSDAAATLQRVIYIYPIKDEELHRHLGELLLAQKQYDGALLEDLAAIASNPVDKAGAQYQLAEAYMASGKKDKAEESVLSALEIAPGYRPAQKLLLELNQSKASQEQSTPAKIN